MPLDYHQRAEEHERSLMDEWGFVSDEALINFICDEQEFLTAQAEAELHRSLIRNDVEVFAVK